jgi:hypothetical protein
MKNTSRKRFPETARHYRSLGLICRQQAARYPDARWHWLSEAERWEHLAAEQAASENVGSAPVPPQKPATRGRQPAEPDGADQDTLR